MKRIMIVSHYENLSEIGLMVQKSGRKWSKMVQNYSSPEYIEEYKRTRVRFKGKVMVNVMTDIIGL